MSGSISLPPIVASANVVAPYFAGGGAIAISPAGAVGFNDPGVLRASVYRSFGGSLPPLLPVDSYFRAQPGFPSTITAGGSWTSELMPSCGAPHVAVGFTLTQAGSLVLNRYLDGVGALLATSVTQAVTANASCVLDASSSTLFGSWNLVLSNTGGASATLASFSAVLGSK